MPDTPHLKYNSSTVTRQNLPLAVDYAISECESQLGRKGNESKSYLMRDLYAALSILRSIKSDIQGRLSGPPGGRVSKGFLRYIIDEESAMEMDTQLRDLILRIEQAFQSW